VAPGIPEFGEAVEKDDDGAVFGTGGDGMQAHISILERDDFHGFASTEQSTL